MENQEQKRSGFLNVLAQTLNLGGSATVKAYDVTVNSMSKMVDLVVKTTPSISRKTSKAITGSLSGLAGLGRVNFSRVSFKGKEQQKSIEVRINEYNVRIKNIYYEIGKQSAEGKSLEESEVQELITEAKGYEQEVKALMERSREMEREKRQKKVQKDQPLQKVQKYSQDQVMSLVKSQKDRAVSTSDFEDRSSQAIFENIANDLMDRDVEVKVLAASELGKLGNPAAVPILIEALKYENTYLTLEIINSLIALESPKSIAVFKEKIKDSNYKVRISALRGVYKQVQNEEAIDILVSLLHDKHPDVRKAAITYLGWKDSKKAIPGLIQSLQDRDDKLRISAINSLTSIKDKSSVASLIRMVSDDNVQVREKAVEAVKLIGGKHVEVDVNQNEEALKEEVEKLTKWWQDEQYKQVDVDIQKPDLSAAFGANKTTYEVKPEPAPVQEMQPNIEEDETDMDNEQDEQVEEENVHEPEYEEDNTNDDSEEQNHIEEGIGDDSNDNDGDDDLDKVVESQVEEIEDGSSDNSVDAATEAETKDDNSIQNPGA